ncbi:MAG TPA: hypothetical protein VE690_07795 [Rhodopila sp.]|nr:hypothetical protein [Rhodopila sp.]
MEVGQDIYFWRHPGGEDRCLITAHGGFLPFTGSFRPADIDPRIRVFFYARENTLLADPGLSVLDGNYHPTNIPTEGDSVTNYLLSKFQVSEDAKAGEKYSHIENKIESQVNWEAMFNDLPDDARGKYVQLRQEMMRVHIVTIRNRPAINPVGTSLKSVVERVFAQEVVTQFYCSFCRGNMLNLRAATTHAARSSPAP